MSAVLPTGIPRRYALLRAEAERLDAEFSKVARFFNPDPGAHEALLRDLSRRESRCWTACALADLVGVEVGDTAPTWSRRLTGPLVIQWRLSAGGKSHLFGDLSVHFTDQTSVPGMSEDGPTALAQALAAVCRDG